MVEPSSLRNELFRTALILLLLFLTGIARAQGPAWYPPENPDPREVFTEAKEDRRAGRYEESLAKHLWFHNNALKYDRALHGVRLSFALSDWRQLANRFPPALEAMRATRETAERWVRENKDDSDAFRDSVALNEQLKERDRTVLLFRWLDENDPEMAESVFLYARDTLIDLEEHELSGKYVLNPESFEDELRFLEEKERMFQQHLDPDNFQRLQRDSRRFLSYSTLLDMAVLVRIGRAEEARTIGDMALKALPDSVKQENIDSALDGRYPDMEYWLID